MRRAIVIAVLLTVGVVAAAVVLANVPVHWAVLLALPAGAVAFAGGLLAGSSVTRWEPEPEPAAAKVTINATFLTERLERATGDPQTFTTRVQPRLRHIAVAALQQDLNTPQAKEALGAELHHLLTAPDARLPSPKRLAELMRRLEDLC